MTENVAHFFQTILDKLQGLLNKGIDTLTHLLSDEKTMLPVMVIILVIMFFTYFMRR